MKRSLLSLLVAFIAILAAHNTRADSTFAGSLLSGHNEGYIAGSISLTVDRGHVSFTSTLFQSWVSGTTIEPVLVVHNKIFPLPFGTGTPGNWSFQEFLGPSPVPAACGLPAGIDPGFGIPQPFMFDGTALRDHSPPTQIWSTAYWRRAERSFSRFRQQSIRSRAPSSPPPRNK